MTDTRTENQCNHWPGQPHCEICGMRTSNPLVERLLEHICYDCKRGDACGVCQLRFDAADEIERLRALLDDIRDVCKMNRPAISRPFVYIVEAVDEVLGRG